MAALASAEAKDFSETGAQFHQSSRYSFYASRSQKRKKDSQVVILFYAFGIYQHKSCTQNVDEIDPGWKATKAKAKKTENQRENLKSFFKTKQNKTNYIECKGEGKTPPLRVAIRYEECCYIIVFGMKLTKTLS